MKRIWQLTYETKPGDGEQTKKFKSFAEAKEEIRSLISQIYVQPYTKAIREEGTHKTYRAAMADFLNDYVSRKDFYSREDQLPSDDSEDYVYERRTLQNDVNEEIDDCDACDEEESTDWFDDFTIYIGKDYDIDSLQSIHFRHENEDGADLKTNMVVMDDETQTYDFYFFVGQAPHGKLRELTMTLTPLPCYGTAAYPIMILRTLEDSEEPLTQEEIGAHIKKAYHTVVERKAIGRNIALLKDLGYDIRHGSDGYYLL